MKSFDWKELLKGHSLFANLRQDQKKKLIDKFLGNDISIERHYLAKRVILREGESGDSIFIIKSGSVRAFMKGKNGEDETELSIMRRGDIFGEIAVFQRTTRSATIEVVEDCTLLEISGQKFLDLLEGHPDIEVRVLNKLSERLRNTQELFMAARLSRIDEKLEKFESRFDTEHEVCQTKIDAELKVTKADLNATLTAAQAIFDNTKLRTDEVIQSAERSRSRLTQAASVVGVIIALFGFIGLNQVLNINKLSDEIEKKVENVKEDKKEIDTKKGEIDEISKKVMETHNSINKKLAGLKRSINESEKYLAINVLLPALYDAVRKHNEPEAIDNYTLIKELELDDYPEYIERARIYVVQEVTWPKNKDPLDFTSLLGFIYDDTENPKDKLLSYYALMADAILANNDKFKSELPKFELFIRDYHGEKLFKDEWSLSEFSKYFNSQNEEKRILHNKIKNLVLKTQNP
jgi:CRP-like cAMP-binding protein